MSDKDLLRLSQVVTSFGPGAMIDLPRWSVMVTATDHWRDRDRRPIDEPRLLAKLGARLHPSQGLATPPIHDETPGAPVTAGIDTLVFPTWFVTIDSGSASQNSAWQRRRLVRFGRLDLKHRSFTDNGRLRPGLPVAPVRFVCACPAGHVEDLDWVAFAHRGGRSCNRDLWLEERGASADLSETWACCDCGAQRALYEAVGSGTRALGRCAGRRPWLGRDYDEPQCREPNRLLVRTASNAYFPQLLSVLSLPDGDEGLRRNVDLHWPDLEAVGSVADLPTVRRFNAAVRQAFADVADADLFAAVQRRRSSPVRGGEGKIKPTEFAVLAGGGRGVGDLADPNSTLCTEVLDRRDWDPRGDRDLAAIVKVVLVHRLREVIAQVGFTRFEAISPDTDGELDLELAVRSQAPSHAPRPLPAVEMKGEGVFLVFDPELLRTWARLGGVLRRAALLEAGFSEWKAEHPSSRRDFPGVAYVMLHTLSHLLMTAIALECGYPAASLRERVYANVDARAFGILIYTGAADTGGTLGGLVEGGREIGRYLRSALDAAALCANDPICAEHRPDLTGQGNSLDGAACHGCVLVAETSCEQRNDHLDRALVVPIVEVAEAAFFRCPPP